MFNVVVVPKSASELMNLSTFLSKTNFEAVVVAVVAEREIEKFPLAENVFMVGIANEKSENAIEKGIASVKEGSVIVVRSSEEIENWSFLLQLMNENAKGFDVVWFKPSDETRLQKWKNSLSKKMIKTFLGLKKFDGSLFAVCFDQRVAKFFRLFPNQIGKLSKTDAFAGFKKQAIAKNSEDILDANIFPIKKCILQSVVAGSFFVLAIVAQVLLNVFANISSTANILLAIIPIFIFIWLAATVVVLSIQNAIGKILFTKEGKK